MTYLILLAALAVLAVLLRPLAALSANALVSRYADTGTRTYPVAAGVHIYRHAIVGLNPAGYLKPHEPGDRLVGLAYAECDASGDTTAGRRTCPVWVAGDFALPLPGVGAANIGEVIQDVSDLFNLVSGVPISVYFDLLRDYWEGQ